MPKYSPSSGAIYPDAALPFYSNLPADLIDISQDEYNSRAGAIVSEESPTEQAPTSVTMYQARCVLIEDELIDDVEAALLEMPEGKEKSKARAAWEYAATVERDSEFTQMLAGALGLTDSQLDSLFTRAGKVK